jgi:hypothetical protein
MTAAAGQRKLQKPVQVAAELKQWKVCSLLLQKVDNHAYHSNYDISTALYHAAKAGQVQLVEQLLAKGAWQKIPWSEPVGDDVDLHDECGCRADWTSTVQLDLYCASGLAHILHR